MGSFDIGFVNFTRITGKLRLELALEFFTTCQTEFIIETRPYLLDVLISSRNHW
jgi:hypothetical protein